MIDVSPFIQSLAGKPVAVFGLARSGLATIKALKSAGGDVLAWDDREQARAAAKDMGAEIKVLDEDVLAQCACLVLAPGVPYTFKPHPVVQAAQKAGIHILCDVEIFSRCIDDSVRTVGITGTNGKSTTTDLLAHVLRSCGKQAVACGNIGKPVLDIDPPQKGSVVVLELSSYQLDLCPAFRPEIAVLLNITPDHLDRHGTMEAYIEAKARMFDGAGTAVIAADDTHTLGVMERVKAAGARKIIPVSRHDHFKEEINNPALRGVHNRQNMRAVIWAALELGCKEEAVYEALRSYGGLAHRQFPVRTIGRVLYVNDSKATNADAADKALGSYDDIYWIAGGLPKDGGLEGLEKQFPRVRHAFLIGQAADEFAAYLEKHSVPHSVCGDLKTATAKAHEMAQADAEGAAPVVLLSPACASFDQFSSFEERGDLFVELVEGLG